MTASRSTARLRLAFALLVATIGLVAVSERALVTGLAGELMQLAGLACVAVAVLGRIWASAFIAGYKDTTLVRTGPYALARHPLYALSTLAMLGVGLASRSLAITTALVVSIGGLHVAAARREDAHLARNHGEDFARYRRAVPAFLPRAMPRGLPERIEVRPRVFRKSFLDAASMLGVYALVRIADAMHATGLTPTWIRLP